MVFRSRPSDTDRLTRRLVVAHEMAHMWFGDLVTMQWWDDLWLNESFAEYLGQRVTGEHAWVSFGAERKAWGHAADRRPTTHPVAGNDAADARTALASFDGISYAKGASVLRQLAGHLGDDVFLDGLRRYITAHAYGNARFADLLDAWTAAGASELDRWAEGWLRTTGLDELSVAGDELVRHSPQGTPRVHSLEVAVLDGSGREIDAHRVTAAGDRTPLRLAAGIALPDARDDTWAKTVLPADAWAAMPELLPHLADARSRVSVWNALRLAAADAEVSPTLAFRIAVAGVATETDDAILGAGARWTIETLLATYFDERGAGAAGREFAAVVRDVAESAEPGSGRQLTAARAAIRAADDPALLADWLAGRGVPSGLVVDADLRWAIVTRLAALGAIDEAAIEAELERDRSSEGTVHAARSRAARPDAAAKEAAWRTLMTDADCPNYVLYALAGGFWQPHQRELTRPFVAAYFADIGAASALRSGWIADRIALLAYPRTAVAESTVAATEALLAAGDLAGGVQRSIADAGDDLRRALHVRRRFGLAPDAA
jgi:aminopeptidase N